MVEDEEGQLMLLYFLQQKNGGGLKDLLYSPGFNYNARMDMLKVLSKGLQGDRGKKQKKRKKVN